MKQTLTQLAEQEMDRKEFLRHIMAAALMIAGGGLILRALNTDLPGSKKSSTVGYGSNTYGTR